MSHQIGERIPASRSLHTSSFLPGGRSLVSSRLVSPQQQGSRSTPPGNRPTPMSSRMTKVRGSRSPPWSDLPSELLELVFLRLPLRADRAVFPAVCRTWCSAVRQCCLPRPSLEPWLLRPDGSATSFPRGGETFQVPHGVGYPTSCGEWLLLRRTDGNHVLMNPFTKATMPLPSLASYSYHEEPVEDPEHYMVPRRGTWLDNKDRGAISVVSLVVCSTSLIAAILAVRSFRTIALCRPGAAAWSVSTQECEELLEIVFLQGKIYTLVCTDGDEDLIAVDIVDEYDSEPRVSRIQRLIKGISLPRQLEGFDDLYLLESHGILLKVCRKVTCKTVIGSGNPPSILETASSELVVFKADLEQHLWAEMRTLGNDQALFLAPGCSRAVRVSPYDVSRDCIFFLDDPMYWLWTCVTSCELYDLKDEKVYSLPMLSWKSGNVPATWIFSLGETDGSANSKGRSSQNYVTLRR